MLAQYATPAELLTAPADEFVADFVGADRALKRLGLATLADVELLVSERPAAGSATAAREDQRPRRAVGGAGGRRGAADGRRR